MIRHDSSTLRIQEYNIYTMATKSTCIALVCDLHDKAFVDVIQSIRTVRPDLIVICGDLVYAATRECNIYNYLPNSGQHIVNSKNALSFLQEAGKIATTFYAPGNHELYFNSHDIEVIERTGCKFLSDSYCCVNGLIVGGMSTPYTVLAGTGGSTSKNDSKRRWKLIFDSINTEWLDSFEKLNGYKILLAHHPEFYKAYLAGRDINLILAGHAHGGQIRIFGKGLFAYGQGLFPKYTRGIYDNKLIVCAGLSNTSKIPRIMNPREIVYVRLLSH